MRELRAAIYARHSTDKQNPQFSADRVEACRSLLQQLDAEVVATYANPEVSGRRPCPAAQSPASHIVDRSTL